jgi:hypothetical protein
MYWKKNVVAGMGNNQNRNHRSGTTTDNDQMAFVVQHRLPADPAHNSHPTVLCFNFQCMEHHSGDCPFPDTQGKNQERGLALISYYLTFSLVAFCNYTLLFMSSKRFSQVFLLFLLFLLMKSSGCSQKQTTTAGARTGTQTTFMDGSPS